MRTLKLLNLHCNKTDDDNTQVDETFLTVDNGKFQGFGPEVYEQWKRLEHQCKY